MTTRKRVGLDARDQASNAAISAAAAAASPGEGKGKPKGIGVRVPADLHAELDDISHYLKISLNSLLVEGAELMRDKYGPAAAEAKAERERGRR